MNHDSLSHRYLRHQHGLTMVELMVAITIGLILTAGIIQIFVNSKQTYRVEEALSRVQESGRLGLGFMANDIRMAGFWGCQPTADNVRNNLNAGTGYIDFTAGAVSGTEGGSGVPDSITLRGADGSSGITPLPNGGSGKYSPLPSASLAVNSPNNLNPDEILLISDCVGGDIFQITNNNPGGTGTVDHNTGTGSPGNASNLSKVYKGDAFLYTVREISYTIAAGADGQPALWRSVNGSNQEIVDDVSDLQILYGEDMDNDRSVDRYVNASNVADFRNVYSVQVQLTIQTGDANTAVNAGGRVSHDFSTTVAIRNKVL